MGDKNIKTIEYARGSVWFCNENIWADNYKGVQHTKRPVVIISANNGNLTSDIVTVAMITSNNKKENLGINVEFINKHNEKNIILCNQIFPINKSLLQSYQGMLPDEVMNKVDEQICVALGISRQYTDLSSLSNIVDKLIQHKIEKAKLGKIANSQEVVNQLYEKIDNAIKTETDLPTQKTETDTINNTSVSSTDSKSDIKTKEKIKKKPKGFWTDERKREFVNDKNTMSLTDFSKKWDIENRSTIYTMIYTFKKQLNM